MVHGHGRVCGARVCLHVIDVRFRGVETHDTVAALHVGPLQEHVRADQHAQPILLVFELLEPILLLHCVGAHAARARALSHANDKIDALLASRARLAELAEHATEQLGMVLERLGQ